MHGDRRGTLQTRFGNASPTQSFWASWFQWSCGLGYEPRSIIDEDPDSTPGQLGGLDKPKLLPGRVGAELAVRLPRRFGGVCVSPRRWPDRPRVQDTGRLQIGQHWGMSRLIAQHLGRCPHLVGASSWPSGAKLAHPLAPARSVSTPRAPSGHFSRSLRLALPVRNRPRCGGPGTGATTAHRVSGEFSPPAKHPGLHSNSCCPPRSSGLPHSSNHPCRAWHVGCPTSTGVAYFSTRADRSKGQP